jgi:hypothetical protein
MTTELDHLAEYIDGFGPSPGQRDVARSILDDAVRQELQSEATSDVPSTGAVPRKWRSRRRRTAVIASLVASVAVAAVVVSFTIPSRSLPHRTVAAQISELADTVQPAPTLAPGQWSSLQLTGQMLADVGSVGTTKTPDAKASIPVDIGVWSNTTGTTCTSQRFGTATFASPVNAQAWAAIGLIVTPFGQPATGCVAGIEAASGGGLTAMTPIDVSRLTHDPAVLAQELQLGTTGVPSIDQRGKFATTSPSQSETEALLQQVAFGRLVALVVGPTTGAWSGYHRELLQTMARLPGIVSLGRTAAHSGKAGVGFTAGSNVVLNPANGAVTNKVKSPVVILDPETGGLLEARNFSIPVLVNAAQDFVGSPTAPVFAQGVSYGVSTQWIDPVPGPGVVTQAQLPTWISGFHSIEAIGNPNISVQAQSNVINPYLGGGNSEFDDWNSPTPSQSTYEITIDNPDTSVDTVVAALEASGLFQSVVVKA